MQPTSLCVRGRGYLTIGSCRVTGCFFFFSPAEPRRMKYSTVTTTTETATTTGSVCKNKDHIQSCEQADPRKRKELRLETYNT